MESPNVFTEEDMVDEIIDFIGAGSLTVSMTTQTIIGHFATSKSSLDRVRAEFREVADDRIFHEKMTSWSSYLNRHCTLGKT